MTFDQIVPISLALVLGALAASFFWFAKAKSHKQEVEVIREQIPLKSKEECLDYWLKSEKQFFETQRENWVQEKLQSAIERVDVTQYIEASSVVVMLPSADVKGRIIGREGRNIRAFEQVTGVDLVIGNDAESVSLSSFEPLRREIARVLLLNLIIDGRIHPARIEEEYPKAEASILQQALVAAKEACGQAQVKGLPKPVLQQVAKLQFCSSFGQNLLQHSVETAQIAGILADELGLDSSIARTGGLLHDIGKSLGPERTGTHAIAGMHFLSEHGIDPAITHCVGAHHHEIAPETNEAQIVILADSLSASRRGARKESLENLVNKVQKLESLAEKLPGVDRAFALHSGRELRIYVKPEELSDQEAEKLAQTVVQQYETEFQPGQQFSVTIIRESRFTAHNS